MKDLLPYTFVFIIFAVCVAGFFDAKKIDETENRTLKELPNFSANYPKEMSEYFNDHFGFREHFVKLHSLIKTDIFKQGVTDEVIEGKDGYLFYKKSIRLYEGNLKESRITEYFENLNAFLAKTKHPEVYFYLVPNKAFVFEKYLPDWVKKSEQRAEIVSALSKIEGMHFLDLQQSLIDSAKPSYLKYDTHWNGIGAHIAYEKIIDFINANSKFKIPQLKIASKQIDEKYSGDLANIIGKKSELVEQNIIYELKPNANAEHKILLIHDSFVGYYLGDMLKQTFAEVNLISYRDFEAIKQAVSDQSPDIIIFVLADRHINAK